MSILLTILKITGMILLIAVAVILAVFMLVLFVPVRYRITANRKEQERNAAGEAIPAHAKIRISWLLHLIRIIFDYPEAACVKAKVLCFTVFRSDREKKPKKRKKKEGTGTEEEEKIEPGKREERKKEETKREEEREEETKGTVTEKEDTEEEDIPDKLWDRIREFFSKIVSGIKNIQYTIRKICDKIKHIIKNIRHYVEIIQSETFGRVWKLCSEQVLLLLKSIRPRKVRGDLLIGMGDPASTGDIMAVYGMLYPIVGNPKSRYYIALVPDFENKILEGKIQVKGKITVFRAVKAAWKIYFNRDMKRMIKMFKREAA